MCVISSDSLIACVISSDSLCPKRFFLLPVAFLFSKFSWTWIRDALGALPCYNWQKDHMPQPAWLTEGQRNHVGTTPKSQLLHTDWTAHLSVGSRPPARSFKACDFEWLFDCQCVISSDSLIACVWFRVTLWLPVCDFDWLLSVLKSHLAPASGSETRGISTLQWRCSCARDWRMLIEERLVQHLNLEGAKCSLQIAHRLSVFLMCCSQDKGLRI